MAANKPTFNRRQFLKASAAAVVSLAAVGSVAYWLKDKRSVRETGLLRPPGAIDEKDFVYACIKCGLCVQICPVHAIKLADWDHYLSYGTPYINPEVQACDFSCDSIQCAETCPTAALEFIHVFKKAGEEAVEKEAAKYPNHILPPNVNPFKVQIYAMKRVYKLGKAELHADRCLAVQGKGYKGPLTDHPAILRPPGKDERVRTDRVTVDRPVCDLCAVYCPLGKDAIVMEKTGEGRLKPKVLDGCVGCGVCQMVCPTDPAAITITPAEL